MAGSWRLRFTVLPGSGLGAKRIGTTCTDRYTRSLAISLYEHSQDELVPNPPKESSVAFRRHEVEVEREPIAER